MIARDIDRIWKYRWDLENWLICMASLATTEADPLCDSIDIFFTSVSPPQRPSTNFWRKASSTAPEKASPFTT